MIANRVIRNQQKKNTRGLTRNYNRILKFVFKGAANEAIRKDPVKTLYRRKIEKGMRPELALLSIARKLATITLILWKRGEPFSTAKMISHN
jgi:transposase